jgi:transcriptional regulator with XRE-family HTH domain
VQVQKHGPFLGVYKPKDYINNLNRKLTSILIAGRLPQTACMSDSVGIALGQRIKQLREAAGLTQADLASLALKSVETISNFERGKTTPSIETLDVLAKHLDCSIADFFSASAPSRKVEDPLLQVLVTKAKLLDRRDRRLLEGFIELLVANSRR